MTDRSALLDLLRESAATFTDSFRTVTADQFHFKSGSDRWSIAETAEHVILAEVGSVKLIRGKMLREAAPAELVSETAGAEARIDARLVSRDNRFPAPDFVLPTGRWSTVGEMVPVFEESRYGLLDFLSSTPVDLSRHAALHPRLGALNGYQWCYFLARHCVRHAEQIAEVKDHPGYPR
jgi:hypothetical protein